MNGTRCAAGFLPVGGGGGGSKTGVIVGATLGGIAAASLIGVGVAKKFAHGAPAPAGLPIDGSHAHVNVCSPIPSPYDINL